MNFCTRGIFMAGARFGPFLPCIAWLPSPLNAVATLMEAVSEQGVIGSESLLGNLSLSLLARAGGSLFLGKDGMACQVFTFLTDTSSGRVSLSLSLGFYLG